MTKSLINKALKDQGLVRVSLLDSSQFPTPIRVNGTLVSGIKLRSHSPLDSVGPEIENAAKARILCNIAASDGITRDETGRFIYHKNSKSAYFVTFHVERFATYDPKMRLDHDYKTSWLLPVFGSEAVDVVR